MDPRIKSFLTELYREVTPVVKDYVMVGVKSNTVAKIEEIETKKIKEQLAVLKEVGSPEQGAQAALEESLSKGMVLVDPKKAVGRRTWDLFHTRAEYYPDQPSQEDMEKMRNFIISTIAAFPCSSCASHGLQYIQSHPPDLSSRAGLKRWLCEFHNAVNVHLGKGTFDCSRL